MWTTPYRLILLVALLAFFACGEPADVPTTPTPPPPSSAWGSSQFEDVSTVDITMDIKPGTCPNPINPKARGALPVAIAGSNLLDVTTIDVASILFEGMAPIGYAIYDTTSPGGCCDLVPKLRVNAGGALVAGTPDWTTDSDVSRSPYVNTGFPATTTQAIDMSDPSIPAGTPMSLFQSERWDYSAAPPMQWEFPVAAGDYTVRLYFAEIYPPAMTVGGRLFDVYLEGNLILDDYDTFADVGGFAGVVKEFSTTVTDGSLSLEFGHVTENPKVNAIEILALGGAAPPDGIDDLVLKFENQDVVSTFPTVSQGDEFDLTITGTLLDGTPFSDTDCVVVVGNGNR